MGIMVTTLLLWYSHFSTGATYSVEFPRFVLSVVLKVPQVYSLFLSVLFSTMSYMISTLFRLLHPEIQNWSSTPAVVTLARLRRCKKLHVLLSNLVHHLNDSFGTWLLMEIPFLFLTIINAVFKIIVRDSWREIEFSSFVFVLYPVVQLSLLCYVCHQIQSQVGCSQLTNLIIEFVNAEIHDAEAG